MVETEKDLKERDSSARPIGKKPTFSLSKLQFLTLNCGHEQSYLVCYYPKKMHKSPSNDTIDQGFSTRNL